MQNITVLRYCLVVCLLCMDMFCQIVNHGSIDDTETKMIRKAGMKTAKT